jgi:hypothetical protein
MKSKALILPNPDNVISLNCTHYYWSPLHFINSLDLSFLWFQWMLPVGISFASNSSLISISCSISLLNVTLSSLSKYADVFKSFSLNPLLNTARGLVLEP